jgi:AraC-like DNA-binding protein
MADSSRGATQVVSIRTGDLDEARYVVSRYFYANFVDLLQPSARLAATFNVVQTHGVTVGELAYGADIRMRLGELGAYHVDVPLSGRLVWRQGAHGDAVATTEQAAVFQPVGETVLERWAADCRLLAVKIDQQALETELERMLGTPVRAPLHLGTTLDLSRGTGLSWARLVRFLASEADNPDGLIGHPVLGARLREDLLRGLLLAVPHRYRERLAEAGRRPAAPRAVRQAVDAIQEHPERPLTVGGLSELVGVGERALQHGFQRHIGMSPMAYLRHVRLARVHEELQANAPGEVRVGDVAHLWGFTHLSRFAALYRTRYGVSPSETLHTGSGRARLTSQQPRCGGAPRSPEDSAPGSNAMRRVERRT